jgi:hypothetical protein|tara:strand:+ start:1257 stop:1469 length:213 start_codon:yes stop_codon:yes gene_type:complete
VKVGDLVKPRLNWVDGGNEMFDDTYGMGVIIDQYYDDVSGFDYFHVAWRHQAEWWMQDELQLVSETNEDR